MKRRFNLNKENITPISLSLLVFIFTVLLPIIAFFQFDLSQQLYPDDFKIRYRTVFIATLLIGIILTTLRYFQYRFPRYSVKRGVLGLLNTVFFLIFFVVSAQIAVINIAQENFTIYLNLTGTFTFIIAMWALFLIKNVYDILDFTKHRRDYERQGKLK